MRWTKHHRLRKRWQFLDVQKRGSKKRASCFLLLSLPSMESQSRIGITVSKKVGHAVIRNRVKRIFREAIRHEYKRLTKSLDIVLIAYTNAKNVQLHEVRFELQRIFSYLSQNSQ